MGFFQNIAAIATIIALSLGAYTHLMSRTVIPTIESIASNMDTPFLTFIKYDLTEPGQAKLYDSISKQKDKFLLKIIGRVCTPTYIAIAYEPDELSNNVKENIEGKDFVGIIFIGRGSNLVNYLLSIFNTSVQIPRLDNADIFLPDDSNKATIGMIDNAVIFGRNINTVKKTIIKINKIFLPEYDKSENSHAREVQQINSGNLGGFIFKQKDIEHVENIVNNLMKNFIADKLIKQKISFVLLNSETISASFDISTMGSLNVDIDITGNVKNELMLIIPVVKESLQNSSTVKIIVNNNDYTKINIETKDFENQI